MRQFINSLSNRIFPVKFALFTDLHYGDIDNYGSGETYKYCREGAIKLQKAVNEWGDLDFAICLGDYIDNGQGPPDGYVPEQINNPQATTDLRYIQSIYEVFTKDRHMVLGNHDPDRFTKDEFIAEVDMTTNYYYFDKRGIRFIVLDDEYFADDDNASYENSNYWVDDEAKSYVPPTQRIWLDTALSTAPGKCIVFTHHVLDEDGGSYFRIINRAVVIGIIETYDNVLAVFNGHEHINRKATINSIDYYTMEAMTKNAYPLAAYGIISILNNKVTIEGFDGQTSYL